MNTQNRYMLLWGLGFILAFAAAISVADRIGPSVEGLFRGGYTPAEQDTITLHRRVVVRKVYNVEYRTGIGRYMTDQDVCNVALTLDAHPEDSTLYYRDVYVTRDSVQAELQLRH